MESLEPNELQRLILSGTGTWVYKLYEEDFNNPFNPRPRVKVVCLGQLMSEETIKQLLTLSECYELAQIEIQINWSF